MQARYDRVIGAGGIYYLYSLRARGTSLEQHAYTVSPFYHHGQLKMFTILPYQSTYSPGGLLIMSINENLSRWLTQLTARSPCYYGSSSDQGASVGFACW